MGQLKMKTPTQNRVKSTRPRPARDFYETPFGLAYYYMKEFLHPTTDKPFILDAGAGTGIWGKAARNLFPKAYIMGVDLSEKPDLFDLSPYYNEWVLEDYLNIDADIIDPDIIIGNPPYSLAEPFIRKSLELLGEYGQLHFLLRLNFLGSQKRMSGIWKEYPPEFVTVSPRRPSFFSTKEGSKTTDAIEYAIFQWNNFKSKPVYPKIRWFDWNYD